MDSKDVVEAIEIEGANEFDHVFVMAPTGMSALEFSDFLESVRRLDKPSHYPSLTILPPGFTVAVARKHPNDEIVITAPSVTLTGDVHVDGALTD